MEPNSTVFVTGGTGFIGTHLVRALTERGHRVRVLSRRADPKPPPGLGWPVEGGPLRHPRVELVRGDITDRASVGRGIRGCEYAFHLAACAKNWAPDPKMFFDMNVGGMQNVLDAAVRYGVKKTVWTSTIMTLGTTAPGEVADEAAPRRDADFYCDYERTKFIAEREVEKRTEGGENVVVVNPTRVYGPGHWTEGNALAALIDDYDRGRVPVLLNRGKNVANYVLVDDVVAGHLAAMEKGRAGERYILGGENISLKRFFRLIDEISGKRHFQIPMLTVSPLVFAWFQKKLGEWFGIYPRITPGWVRYFASDSAFSSAKAERELGYRPTPLDAGLRMTYEWLLRVREEREKEHRDEREEERERERERERKEEAGREAGTTDASTGA